MEFKFSGEIFSRLGRILLMFTMKMLIFFCCSATLAFSPLNGLAQDAEITIEEDKKISVKQAFRLINKQTDYKFIYRNDLIKDAPKQELKKGVIKAGDLLEKFLEPINITFEFTKQETIVVRRKPIDNGNSSSGHAGEEKIQSQISGKVTDVSGTPLIGVTVIEEGTNNGTTTNFDGDYTIAVGPDASLRFSYLGYQNVTLPVTSDTMDVTLQESTSELDEVVVIGYGTVRKSDLTGAVSTIKSEEITEIPVASLDQAIQGRAAGVQVMQSSNAPGGTVSIRIRGGNSLTAGVEPLYVVDGFPIARGDNAINITNPLASIPPSDIQSIEILKDASATALYGSRGANGVVLITTKRGVEGKPTINFSASYGTQTVVNTIDMMDSQNFARMANAAYVNDGLPEPFSQSAINSLTTTDWQDEIFRNGSLENYSLSVTGGTDKNKYAISGNYFGQDGLVKSSGLERFSLRANNDVKLSKNINLGSSISVSRTTLQGVTTDDVTGTVASAIGMLPYLPVFQPDGSYTISTNENDTFLQTVENFGNPVHGLDLVENRTISNRILANVFFEIEILKGLKAKISAGGDIISSNNWNFIPEETAGGMVSGGSASQNRFYNENWLNENILTYDASLGEKHRINMVAGFTQQTNQERTLNASGTQFVTDVLGAENLGGASSLATSNNRERWDLLSYLGRVNYAFNDRLLLTAAFRADGSSKFAEGNKWGYFPSGAIAYRLDQEDFIKNSGFINNLKIRASYGLTGNENIAPYLTLPRLFTGTLPGPTPPGGGLVQEIVYFGQDLDNLPNPDLQWEKTASLDVGLEASLFNNRLSLEMGYYDKETTDLLLTQTLPEESGVAAKVVNAGGLVNKGFEFFATSYNIDDEFKWRTSVNLTANKNEVTDLNGLEEIQRTGSFGGDVQVFSVVREGEPIGNIYGFIFDGIYQTGDTDIPDDLQPGDIRFRDIAGGGPDGDEPDGIINGSDRTIIGNAQPDFFWGMTNNFSYKGIDLSVFIQGVQGNEVWNWNRMPGESLRSDQAALASVTDFWTPANPSTTVPRPTRSRIDVLSTRHVEDASYVRVRNITLGYSLPLDRMNIEWAKKIRLYTSVQNLLTITNYSGYDPDVNSFGQSTLDMGVDRGSYPLARTINLGLDISF